MSKEQILWATAAKVKTEEALKLLVGAKANLEFLDVPNHLARAIEETNIALAKCAVILKNVK